MAPSDHSSSVEPLSLASILLRTRKKHFHILHGEHESIFGGRGMSFREVREYSSEDDIRHLNWKITARTGTPMVNLYNETKQIPVVLVYLNSAGLYGTVSKTKRETAIEVLTALSYATLSNHDTLTPLLYDTSQSLWLAPTRDKGAITHIFSTASALDPLKKQIDFDALCTEIMQKIKRKSLLFLIGDFWEFSQQHDLGQLAFYHELYCIMIRERAEESLTLRGTYEISDPYTARSQTLSIDRQSALRYQALVQAHDARLQKHFDTHRISAAKIYTDEDAIEALAAFVRR